MGYQKKHKAFLFGQKGETIACLFLRLKGYQILYRNLKTPVGEIDIIAKRRKTVCFIEVKSRSRMEDALTALSLHQQKRILRAAQAFLSENAGYSEHITRFDFIAVASNHWPIHIQNAWLDDT